MAVTRFGPLRPQGQSKLVPADTALKFRARAVNLRPRQTADRISDLVKAPVGEIAIVFGTVLLAVFGLSYGRPINEVTNIVVPGLLILAQGFGIVSLVSRSFDNIWTPLVWNRVAFIFYFGVGSLVPGFVNDQTLSLIEGFYYFFPEDVAKYNLINALFALVFLVTSGFVVSGAQRMLDRSDAKLEPSAFDRRVLGLILIGFGLAVYFGLAFDSMLGVQGATSSVLISQLANCAHVGIFLLGSWALANRSPWIYFAQGVTLLLFVTGMITLAKYEAILPVIMLGLAYVYERRSLKTAAIVGASIYLVFSAISGPTSYARLEAGSSDAGGGGFGSATVGERVRILLSYGSRDASSDEEEYQTGWARLSYVNAGTFAINQYDNGLSGNSFEYLPLVWLPRMIYPSKPNLTDKAREFNVAVSGSDTSSSTPGIPSEGYWNYGWIGVIGVAIVMAAILALWSLYTILALQSGAWYLLLVILLGMRVGTRVDGMVVTDIVGPVGYAVLGHIGLTFINRLILRRKQQRQRLSATARA